MAKKESACPPPKPGRAAVLEDEVKPAEHPSALLDTRDVPASLQ